MTPLMPSPGRPKMVSTPQAIRLSIRTSAPFRDIATSRRHRLELDLQPSGLARVESLIGLDDGAHRLCPGEDLHWVDGAGRDQVEQLRDVFAMMAIAHLHGQVLVHRLTDRKILLRWRINADDR